MKNQLSKTELTSAIQQIINESLQETKSLDGTKVFNIRRYVNGLIEEGHKNPKLMTFLIGYENMLNNGAKDFMLYEQFGKGLEEFARGNKVIKSILETMNEVMREHASELKAYVIIENIPDAYSQNLIREAYNEFLADKSDFTKSNLLESIQGLYDINDYAANSLMTIVAESVQNDADYFQTRFMNESAQASLERRLEESRKEKLTSDIFKKVERYLQEQNNAEELRAQKISEEYSLEGIANKSGLKLYERIANVMKTDAINNPKLKEVLLQYSSAIGAGAYEERLYETFLQNTSNFDYLLPVERMRNAIMEVASKKHEEIALTKILEEMKDSYNSYIYVNLIQEDVARYVKNPTPTNRVQLRNALMPYASDPYINEMFNIIYRDDSVKSNTLEEKALNIKEQVELIRQNVSVESIYTPVQYIRENECIFNVHGQYFIKKGNNISVLNEKYTKQLDSRFVELCHLVNDPKVQILEDRIILSGNEIYATIFEGFVEINSTYRESQESLRRLNEMCIKYENYDTNFYIMCSCLLENFNSIAKVDWAKHIVLNENTNISADLFKLDKNIYMALHNNTLMKHTFYRNVNPIFCKNTINEHMGLNVASLFGDMLPDYDKMILALNEAKNEYESSIQQYEEMIVELEAAKDDAASEDLINELDSAIKDAKEKLEDVKAEYKDWQKTTEETLAEKKSKKDDEDDVEPEVTTEINNEPLDADEVEDYKDELSTPLSNMDDMTPAEEAGAEIPEMGDEEIDDIVAQATEMSDEEDEDPELNVEDDEEFVELDTDKIIAGDEEDDDIFDDEEDEDAEAEVPAEDVSDEEDIIITDEEDELEQEPMETIEMGDEATDIFGGDVENPLDALESDLYAPENESAEFGIANIMFNSNVNGTVSKAGEVIVLRPVIDQDGNNHVNTETYKFYLDGEENMPIISADGEISTAVYNAMVNAIKEHPQYETVCEIGVAVGDVENVSVVSDELTTSDSEDWEDEYEIEMSDEDRGTYTIGDDFEDEEEAEETSEDDIQIASDDELSLENIFDDVEDEDTEDAEDEDTEDVEDEDAEEKDPVVVYKDEEGTEIEIPAADADKTAIPESAKKINENRKSIIGISKKSFFVNEAAVKASKNMNEETVDLSKPEEIDGNGIETISHSANNLNKTEINSEPIENFNRETEPVAINAVYNFALECAANSEVDLHSINVSDLIEDDFEDGVITYFNIKDNDSETEYTVYAIGGEIFYRPASEFYQIRQDVVDGVPGASIDNFRFEYADPTEPMPSYINREDCMFIITSIFSSFTGRAYDSKSVLNDSLTENCKIRKHNKLGADTKEVSKKFHDAKYGTKAENDFKQEIEAKQKLDGTIGALDAQQESVETETQEELNDAAEFTVEEETIEEAKPQLPNVNKKMDEALARQILEAKAEDIVYEPGDRVLVDDEKGQVTDVKADIDGTQIVVIMVQGHTVEKMGTEIKPDPDYFKPTYAPNNFELGPDGLNLPPKNEELPKDDKYHRDLNESLIECNIVVDGHKFNFNRQLARLSDFVESSPTIRVISEDGSEANWPNDSIDVDQENWPYAVIANAEDEPIRKIKVNPVQYCQELDDEAMIEVLVADKLTQMPKKIIKIIS